MDKISIVNFFLSYPDTSLGKNASKKKSKSFNSNYKKPITQVFMNTLRLLLWENIWNVSIGYKNIQ